MLQGKKTYIVGIAGLIYAALGYFLGHIDASTAITAVQVSLVGMGLRAAL